MASADHDEAGGHWECLLCGVRIFGHRRQADHMKNYGYTASDPRRCDNVVQVPCADNVITVADPCQNREPPFANDPRCVKLLSRRGCAEEVEDDYIQSEIARPVTPITQDEPTNMLIIQGAWTRYTQQTEQLACSSFWRFFLALLDQPQVAIDAALQAARSTFLRNTSKKEIAKFPSSKRELLRRMKGLDPPFWPKVTHSLELDLNGFNIDKKLTFHFLNPIWAWIIAARRIPHEDLQWKPKIQVHRVTGQRLYGGGVQYGEAFESACRSCPTGTYPMGINLHFDGATAHSISATPITIAVANCNSQSTLGHVCIGFFPKTELGKHFSSTADARKVKHYIRQRCIAAILSVLEEGARRGVICRLCVQGTERVRTLYPRLLAMSLDQPEAQAYFGMKNATSCSKCRFILYSELIVCFTRFIHTSLYTACQEAEGS